VRVPFDLEPAAVQRALNVRLPLDVRVLSVEEAAPWFHARFDATGKAYRYRLATTPVLSPFDRRYAWHVIGIRDVDRMRQAATALVGRHDFSSFQARGAAVADTVRTIDRVDVLEREDGLVIEVEGDGFLRHMVRAIVGTLVEVGGGQRAPESLSAMLEARDRRAGGPTAPACGLTLVHVRY
jgi:tRNA pseudouridine38-40 synthase